MPEIPPEILDNALEKIIKETDIAALGAKTKDQAYSIGYEMGQQAVRGIAAAYPKGPMGEMAPNCPYCGVPLQFTFRSRTSRAVRASFPIYHSFRLSMPVNGNQPTPYPFWQCKKCHWFTPYKPPARPTKPYPRWARLMALSALIGIVLMMLWAWSMPNAQPAIAQPSPTPTPTPTVQKTFPHKLARGQRRSN
jgi:hypothetical protein